VTAFRMAPARARGACAVLLLAAAAFPSFAGPGIPCLPDAAARAAAARAARPAGTLEAGPPDSSRFVLFGWVSPPAESTTEARIDEMAGIGFNLLLPAWLDRGCPDDNHARLDWAAARGMRCLIWDSRLQGAFQWFPTFDDTLHEVVAEYRDDPGLWGYYLGDEPPETQWPMLGRLRAELRGRDPTHYAWDNLVGRVFYGSGAEYENALRRYAQVFQPATLSVDHYDFRTGGDYGLFVENLQGVRRVAAERGIPFWNIVQLTPHLDVRPLEPGELRWQVSHSLAYGARGIGYFTYWTPDPDPAVNWQPAILDHEGHRTAWYDFLAGFDPGVRAAGEALSRATWRRTTHSESVPSGGTAFTPDSWISRVEGRAVIGEFRGPRGERLALVGNSDSLSGRTIVLWPTDDAQVRVIASGSPALLYAEPDDLPGAALLAVQAGDFALLELEPRAPRALHLAPNPAAGEIRFAVGSPTTGLRLDVLDLRGRRVWSVNAPGESEVVWDGRDAHGAPAPPGVYFARMPGSAPGVGPTLRRFVWLGAR